MAEPTATRKLTTILAADVVSYSAHMAANEEGTHARLRAYRHITDALIAKHGGRIFNTAGDSFLAEFPSAVEAVRCAISIQEEIAQRNSKLAQSEQLWWRIGVNVGDVIVDDGDLLGDAVNIAARLEGLATAGGICISASTFVQVKNKLSVAFDDIGGQSVKNIPEPVQAFKIVPGRPAVNPSRSARRGRTLAMTPTHWAQAGGALIGVAALAGYLAIAHRQAGAAPNRFDGAWLVEVSEVAGCTDNTGFSYRVRSVNGQIDEPTQRRPKKGSISDTGEFFLTVLEADGAARGTLEAMITGGEGEGKMTGRRAGCQGRVKLTRVK